MRFLLADLNSGVSKIRAKVIRTSLENHLAAIARCPLDSISGCSKRTQTQTRPLHKRKKEALGSDTIYQEFRVAFFLSKRKLSLSQDDPVRCNVDQFAAPPSRVTFIIFNYGYGSDLIRLQSFNDRENTQEFVFHYITLTGCPIRVKIKNFRW